jgi:hypothetical protein
MSRKGAARKSGSPGRRERSRRGRGSRDRGRRGFGEKVDERTEAHRLADMGWVEWGGELIWAVGFTSGGAPYGLRACDFDPADLRAMGLDVAEVDEAGLASGESWMDEPDTRRDGDVVRSGSGTDEIWF